MSTSPEPATTDAASAAPAHEQRVAIWLTVVVLATLTLVKPLGGIPVVGTIGFTLAEVLQLYLPLWRAGKLGRDYDFVGLHWRVWRADLRLVLWLCAVMFPPFILAHHIYLQYLREWVLSMGWESLAQFLPHRTLRIVLPADPWAWLSSLGWLANIIATHVLGVALPEETFYRGYLQPRLEERWRPRRRVLGTPLGRAALLAAALFALGHFLGEWNPLRLGPFFPALVFAWQRNATGSVVGAIAFHAACNILGQVLFSLYVPL